ncbi:DUF4375 domain-containing protein [Paenalcaligenes sp. Me131]|uniref:DMP19 family protein n=1 Tax=Paenalcaligenes sp. Me131 TaxID=3392636 RepID=UPI003D2A0399
MDAYSIAEVQITESDIVLNLHNGSTLSTPIQRYIRVEKASPAERTGWELTEDGYGVNWPQLWKPFPTGMVSVWDLLQDPLYEAAMKKMADNEWDISRLTPRDQELVALWRLEADVNNGGFLQFFCNWGEENCLIAIGALEAIGSSDMLHIVQQMYALVEPYGQTDAAVSLSDLPVLITEEDNDRMYELDQAFWDYPEPLPELVVRHYL